MLILPKSWFRDEVSYIPKTVNNSGWDVEDETTIREPLVVTGVRFSGNKSIDRTLNNMIDNSVAKLYVHPQYSSFTEFEKGNQIEFNGQKYSIQNVELFQQPTNNMVHHWELELI